MQLTACTPSCRDNPPVSNMIDARSHIIFGHQGPPRPPAADTNKRRCCCSSPSLDGAVLCVVTATLWRERVMLGCGCVRGVGVRGRIVTGEKQSGRVNTAGCTGSRPLPVRPQEISPQTEEFECGRVADFPQRASAARFHTGNITALLPKNTRNCYNISLVWLGGHRGWAEGPIPTP